MINDIDLAVKAVERIKLTLEAGLDAAHDIAVAVALIKSLKRREEAVAKKEKALKRKSRCKGPMVFKTEEK